MRGGHERIYISPPQVTEADIDMVVASMRSGWIAPIGPDLNAFEEEIAEQTGVEFAVGLSSGTAALHLALKYLNIGPRVEVIIPTVTFAATAFPVQYVGATPVFVDIDQASWNLDIEQVAHAIRMIRGRGGVVGAVIPVDLYGTPANYHELMSLAAETGVPVIEDAAEALGGRHFLGQAGSFGEAGILSFNGNKIITTSGGGMLLTNNHELAAKARYWSSQSREPFPWYEHHETGYNYRLSNILAAIGRSQLSRLSDIVAKRRQIREWYRERLCTLPGVSVQEDPPWGSSNAWLTIAVFDCNRYSEAPRRIREHLEANNIESRPIWKPLHLQPVFLSAQSFLTGRAEALFRDGLCLPSGTTLTIDDIDRVCVIIRESLRE